MFLSKFMKFLDLKIEWLLKMWAKPIIWSDFFFSFIRLFRFKTLRTFEWIQKYFISNVNYFEENAFSIGAHSPASIYRVDVFPFKLDFSILYKQCLWCDMFVVVRFLVCGGEHSGTLILFYSYRISKFRFT